jgi:phosphoribosylformylglycinamidine synthase
VDAASALARYNSLHAAIRRKLVSACHDLSDGGLGAAVAEMAIGGRLGAAIDLARVPVTAAMTITELLYSEPASRLLATVPQENAAAFEALFKGQCFACIGVATDDSRLTITRDDAVILAEPVEELARAFKATLDW